MAPHLLSVFADYHQFYVWDAGTNPSAPEDYTDEDVRRMVKVAPSVVVVQPVRNMAVPVELEVHTSDPGVDAKRWDHIAECATLRRKLLPRKAAFGKRSRRSPKAMRSRGAKARPAPGNAAKRS